MHAASSAVDHVCDDHWVLFPRTIVWITVLLDARFFVAGPSLDPKVGETERESDSVCVCVLQRETDRARESGEWRNRKSAVSR